MLSSRRLIAGLIARLIECLMQSTGDNRYLWASRIKLTIVMLDKSKRRQLVEPLRLIVDSKHRQLLQLI